MLLFFYRDPRYTDFEFVKQICSFIMAYSFTDNITAERDAEDGMCSLPSCLHRANQCT